MAERLTRCRPLLGTFVEVTADSDDSIGAAFDAIARVHALMGAHDPESDLSHINRFAHREPVEVHAWTAAVMERAIDWSKRSEGVFDIVRAGAIAIDRGLLPLHPDQPPAGNGDWRMVQLSRSSVSLLEPACLDLGGIAKGFAVDRAIEALKAAGSSLGLVNAGGDIAGFGPHPWPVQVVEPRGRRAIANVAVLNGAVATSSIQPDSNDDHLFARSRGLLSATVCAPSAMDADALTKIVLSGSRVAAPCLESAGGQAFVLAADGQIRPIEAQRQAA